MIPLTKHDSRIRGWRMSNVWCHQNVASMEIPRKWRVVEVAKPNIELNAGFSNKPRSTTGGSTSLQLWWEVACSKFLSNRLTCPPSIKRVNWTSKKWRDFMRKSWNMISKWRMVHPKFAKIPSTAPTPLAPRRRHLSGPVLGSLAWRRTVMRHWAPEDLTIFSWDPWNLGLKNRPNLRPQSDPEIPIDLWLSWICFFGLPKKQKNVHYRFPSHGGFSIGKINNHLKQTQVIWY